MRRRTLRDLEQPRLALRLVREIVGVLLGRTAARLGLGLLLLGLAEQLRLLGQQRRPFDVRRQHPVPARWGRRKRMRGRTNA